MRSVGAKLTMRDRADGLVGARRGLGGVVLMYDVQLGLPGNLHINCALARRIFTAGFPSRTENQTQRSGENGREVDQLGDRSRPQDHEHQDAELLGGSESAEGEYR